MTSCGIDNYRVDLFKNGQPIRTTGAQLQTLSYSRALDDVSTASATFITAGSDCCGMLGLVDHWNTDLVISVTNPETNRDEVVWRGPISKPLYEQGSVTIPASDVLSWMTVRVVPIDLTYDQVDVSEIGVGIWNASVMSVDPPTSSIVQYPSGVVESRKIEASSLRYGWNVLSEMLEAGLDVTTYGSQVIFGIPPFQAVTLTDQDVAGSVAVEKDGSEFGNLIYTKAAQDVVGQFPPGARAGNDAYPRNGYPLVERVVSDSQLPDVQSAQNAAEARWLFGHNGVRRVRADGGLVLLPTSKIDVKTLIAGQPVTFAANETCYTASETLRVGRLDVTVAAGLETATIQLQPYGGIPGGSDAG